MPAAGKFKRRVLIEDAVETINSHGEAALDYQPRAQVFAAIDTLTGRALLAASQVFAEVTATLTIRYREGITAAQRVVAGGAVFEILGVVDTDLRHEELVLYVRALT